MYMLPHLPFVGLALFFSSALAATIPQGTTLTTPMEPAANHNAATPIAPATNNTLNATSNANFVCGGNTRREFVRPDYQDCAGALLSLPFNAAVGIFYNTGAGNYQLPVFETYRSCQVLVEVRSRYARLQSSWLAVHAAATELNIRCLSDHAAVPYAYKWIDEEQTVKVTLKGPQRSLGDGNGGTDATATS